jgi:FKBP-type peptidyl-prolyl cis-trans isomerase FkpA
VWKLISRGILGALLCAAILSPMRAPAATPKSERDKTLYALGLAIAQSLDVFGLTEAELARLKEGLTDGVLGRKTKVSLEEYKPKIRELAQNRAQGVLETEKKAGDEILRKAAVEKGAVKTPSGVVYIELQAGKGPSPKPSDRVKVHYHGTLRDGTVFDSSVQRGEPATFDLDGVIPCWTEGVQKMKVGGKAKLVCPGSQAYGDRGRPPAIRPGAVLTFEVQLLDILKPEPEKKKEKKE